MHLNLDHINEFYQNKILMAFNCGSPSNGRYGWMPAPWDVHIPVEMRLEARSGLYGGHYDGCVGAPGHSGLCTIGSFSYAYSPLPAGLSIGRYTSISNGLMFLDSHHQTHLLTTAAMTFRPHNNLWSDILREVQDPLDATWDIYGHKSFPKIGNDVWIGRDVTLSMGITIGNGAIIAAKSVVTKDVPPYTIVGGNPAQVIRNRFPDDIGSRLNASQWWNKDPYYIAKIMSLHGEKAIEGIERDLHNVDDYKPKTFILNNEGIRTEN